MRPTSVLGPAVAGTWYPRNREELADTVDGLLTAAGARSLAPRTPVTALIAPHAGFAYSGAVAASTFLRISERSFDRVVLLGPSHYFAFRGAAIPDAAGAYRTPLGDMPIDRDAIATLRGEGGFVADDTMFEPEHALEAELPFLQRTLRGDASIVPILFGGRATHDDATLVAKAIAPLVSASTLVVVSSDFTHFGPRFGYEPFKDDVPARLRALDMGAIAAIEAGDAVAFARYVETTRATICGHRAIDALLALQGRPPSARLVEYDTSGRMTGTWDHSVSYAGIAFPGEAAGAA
jgi:AmmeMemoRadiSam system protein B